MPLTFSAWATKIFATPGDNLLNWSDQFNGWAGWIFICQSVSQPITMRWANKSHRKRDKQKCGFPTLVEFFFVFKGHTLHSYRYVAVNHNSGVAILITTTILFTNDDEWMNFAVDSSRIEYFLRRFYRAVCVSIWYMKLNRLRHSFD